MKKLSVALVIVVAALLGLPGLLGKLAQDEVQNQIALTAGNPAMNVSIGDYDRGWFSSTVRYEIGFTDEYLAMIEQAVAAENEDGASSNANGESLDKALLDILSPFELISEVSHGPVGLLDGPFFGLFKSVTTESPNNPRLNDFLAEANMPYLVIGRSTTGLFGNTTFDFEMPASQGGNESDTLASKLNFSGATGHGSYAVSDSSNGRIELVSSFDNLSIEDGESEFTMSNVKMTADSTSISKALWIGPISTSIGSFVLADNSDDEGVEVAILNMVIDVDSNYGRSNETLDVKMSYRIGEINVEGQEFSDIEFAVAMNELSVQALEQYNQSMQDIALAHEPDAQEEMYAALVPMLHEFISHSPTISLNPMKLSMNDENFLADITLNIDGSSLPALDNVEFMDIGMWMQMVSGKAGLTLSEAMATLIAINTTQSQLQDALGDQREITADQINQMAAAQAPILLKTLVQQGMLQSADGQISAGVTFKNGELLLNGQPIPLEALLGM